MGNAGLHQGSDRLLSSAQMREADRQTIEDLGLPGVVLMENAGAAATAVLQERVPEWRTGLVLVLAGSGNNGGDGVVMARRLHQAGGRVVVVLLGEGTALRGDARIQHRFFLNIGGTLHELTAPDAVASLLVPLLRRCVVVVDAIFGTGLTRPVSGVAAEVIRRVQASGKPVLAVDLPSGVCADTGRILGCAAAARWCVTFAAEKLGHRLHPGAGLCGERIVVPIGIPEAVLAQPGHRVALNRMGALHWPRRAQDAHKGDCGRVLIVAGSVGMEGAAILVARGAARVGAGLITVAVPEAIQPVVTAAIDEAMTLPLPRDPDAAVAVVRASGLHPDRLAIGPGLGRQAERRALLTGLLDGAPVPAVLDADALTLVAGDAARIAAWARARLGELVLTPHPGEMAGLLGVGVAEVQGDRLGVAQRAAREWGCWVVLKGAGTVIASADGRAWINPSGNAGLAAGGSGDLLTGIVVGLWAQGWPTESAVRAGVWLHGAAADACAAEAGMAGMVAGDLLPHVRRLRNRLE